MLIVRCHIVTLILKWYPNEVGGVASIKYHYPKHFGKTKDDVKRSSGIGLQKEEKFFNIYLA